jgi:acetoin utilization protein AcuB
MAIAESGTVCADPQNARCGRLHSIHAKVLVEEAMTSHVYGVAPETGLDVVAESLAEHKYGSAVVLQNSKVVGILTTNDACRALAELLHSRLAK